jgi:hypothetical protein
LGRHAAWTKVEVAFSTPAPWLSFWELADALAQGAPDPSAKHPHAFLSYCIKQGWLERV